VLRLLKEEGYIYIQLSPVQRLSLHEG